MTTDPQRSVRPARVGRSVLLRGRARRAVPRLLVLIVVVVLAGAALGQGRHDLSVRLPEYLGIAIVDGAGGYVLGASALRPKVEFDYEADPVAYWAQAEVGGSLPPSAVYDFSDLRVRVQRGVWLLLVQADPLVYGGPGTGAGLVLGDVRVAPGSASGLAPGFTGVRAAAWRLDTTPRAIALGWGSTVGWASLGFNGLDYLLDVQGDEDAGTYATVVTYTLLNP